MSSIDNLLNSSDVQETLKILNKTEKELKDTHDWNIQLAEYLKDVPENKHNLFSPLLTNAHKRHDDNKRMASAQELLTLNSLKQLETLFTIISVQPLQGPVGMVYTMQYSNEGTDRKTLQILTQAVEARTRKLQTVRKMEPDHLASADEIVKTVPESIAKEIVSEHLTNLYEVSTKCETVPNTPEELFKTIKNCVNMIGEKTQIGYGNKVIIPLSIWDKVYKYLNSEESLNFSVYPEIQPSPDLSFVGTMGSEKFKNLIDLYIVSNPTFKNVLVGNKNHNGEFGPYIYSPYIMCSFVGVVVDPNTFEPLMPFMTRYGMTMVPNVSDYFQEINCEKI